MRHGRHGYWSNVDMPAPDTPCVRGEHMDFSERKTYLNSLPASATLELDALQVSGNDGKGMKQESACGAWFTARVPGFTPPSFRSFAISRMYVVKIKVRIEVAGKEFEQEVVSGMREMRSVAG
jgi:hypothetical protein